MCPSRSRKLSNLDIPKSAYRWTGMALVFAGVATILGAIAISSSGVFALVAAISGIALIVSGITFILISGKRAPTN